MSSRFFLDRSLGGKIVPDALHQAGWEVLSMMEHYGRAGQAVADVDWITELNAAGYTLITADHHVLRNPLERRAINKSGAVVFVLPTGALTGPQTAARLVRHSDAIHRLAESCDGPAAFAV